MHIRKAVPTDLAVPVLMLHAMEEIVFGFIGQTDRDEATTFMTTLFQNSGNQYSYTNTFVAVDDTDTVIGSITAYDGNALQQLRAPVLKLISDRYGRQLTPENETDGNELYLDTIAVAPDQQGKGIGSYLIRYLLNHAQAHREFPGVGLLVNAANPDARRLYERLGFRADRDKHFAGGHYHHLFYAINENRAV